MPLSLLVGLSLAVGAPGPKDTPRPAPKLEGEWVVETYDGPKEVPPGSVTMRFADGKISIKEGMREKPEDAGYTVDLTKKPATIDIRPDRGPKDQVLVGILEVTGDTMKMCFARDGRDRPTEFKGDPANGVIFITLKRLKADR